ncbi:hypothetical protein CYMTET_29563 [Cymbomonas tetramitiformis]|uniref:IMS import disulfide relay-system CHCH-CHCH-like Cx9C domain-containing protein n=1 Tax=Cymbomonas tetramitiformis TaxID=36881 RepID=A0AAE0FM82_9CHLO|nr:hypothetical protein CYMTET_46514 [Cymbomonas tetramitiformis]KAK3261531.1 hypothetical protein CYMTET_29563 [Cymbomonas tetramitiformis]
MGKPKDRLYVNVKKLKQNNLACMAEMMNALTCLKDNNFTTEKCGREITQVNTCTTAQGKKNNPVTINYHLQRLAKGRF